MWGLGEVAVWVCRALRQLGLKVEGPRTLVTRKDGTGDVRIALLGSKGKIVMRFCRKDPKAGTWRRHVPHVLSKPISYITPGHHSGHKYYGVTLEFKCDRITEGFGNSYAAHMGVCPCLACQARRRILELFYRGDVTYGNEKAPYPDCGDGI
jgi:hypothetical protein